MGSNPTVRELCVWIFFSQAWGGGAGLSKHLVCGKHMGNILYSYVGGLSTEKGNTVAVSKILE